jgi:ATP-binding cassette subfamily B protein
VSRDWQTTLSPLRAILGRFWESSGGLIALVVLISIAAALASVSAPYVFSRLIDGLTADKWAETIVAGFGLYAILMGLALALQQIALYLAAMSAENLSFITGTSFFDRLVRKSAAFFIEHNPAEIQTAQVQGAQALYVIIRIGLIVLLPGASQLLLTLFVLGATLNWEVVTIVVIYGVTFIALTYFSNIWAQPHLKKAVAAGQENAKFVGNALTGMETLRYFGSTPWMSERFTRSARDVFESWKSFCIKHMVYAGVFGLALAVQFAITFALLLPRHRQGQLSVGDLVLFNALLLQLNQPFQMAGQAIEELVRSTARFMPFARMWAEPEDADVSARSSFTPTAGRLEFEHVGFAYEDERGVDNVSFVAKRGPITFITGETGSGKSTIFRLALKSLAPVTGRITADGVDLRKINRADWYAAIGVVPQEVMLLNDTLTTNIVLGRPLDGDRLRSAAARAAILERIEAMPLGFETVVGERGLKLSGGERQRIAIARALYADPKILFLDEASSALDDATEREVMDEIRRIAGEVTVLAITHRKTTIRAGDHVVALVSGRAGSQS